MPADRPACLITGTVSPYRREPFRLLAAAEGVEVIAYEDAGAPVPGLTVHRTTQAGAVGLVASGRFRAVICGLGGRVALPGAYLAARARGLPFVLWATIWAHPRTPAHALSHLPLRRLYRSADAIATYGPHVSAYVRAQGARSPVFEAPQAVDADFWSQAAAQPQRQAPYQALFVGRIAGEKGIGVLTTAWHASGLRAPRTALVLVGGGRFRAPSFATSAVLPEGPQPPGEVRNFYAGSDVVVVPSVPTRAFLEPWGLVVNEAFHQGKPVIASTAVGAVAGGLVRDGRNGLVVPANDPQALADALRRLHDDPALRDRLGRQARLDVAAYTPSSWAEGMSRALAAAGVSRTLPSLP